MTLEARIDWSANAFTTSAKKLAPPGKDGRCNIAAPLLRRALCAQPLTNTDPKSIEYIQQHPEHTPSAAVWEIQAYETVINNECPDCAVASICNRKEKVANEENVFQSWMILGNGALGQKAENLIKYQPSDQNIQIPVGIVLTTEYHEALLRADSNPEAVISWNNKIANLFDQIPLNQPIAIRSSAINEGPGGEYQSFFFTKTDNNSSNLSLFRHYIAMVLHSYDSANPNNEIGAMGILIQPIVGRNYPDSNIYAPDISAVISEDNKGRYINFVSGAGTTLTNGSFNTTKVYLDDMDSLNELIVSNKPHAYFRTDESGEFQANLTKRFRIQDHNTLQTLKSLMQSGKYFELGIVDENIFITQVDDEVGISDDIYELPPMQGRPVYEIQTTDILGRGIRETQGVIIVDRIDDETLELLEKLNRQNQGHLIIFSEEVSSKTNYFMSRHLGRIHISNAMCVIESQGSRERLGGHLAQGNGKEHWQSILKHLKTLFHGVAEENLQALLLSSQPLQGSRNIKLIPEIKIKISQTSDSVRVEILSEEEEPTFNNDELFRSVTFITGKIMNKPQANQLSEGIGLLLTISDYLSTPQYKLSDNNILSRSIESQLSAKIKPEKLLSDLITTRDRINNSYHIRTQRETYGLSDDLIPELSLLNTLIKRIQAIIEFKEA